MAAVRERRSFARHEREQWLLWQTRTLAGYIAATVPVEKGKDNPLLEAAQKIGDPDAADQDGTGEPARTVEPRTGSYENFMSAYANPRRWAGGG